MCAVGMKSQIQERGAFFFLFGRRVTRVFGLAGYLSRDFIRKEKPLALNITKKKKEELY